MKERMTDNNYVFLVTSLVLELSDMQQSWCLLLMRTLFEHGSALCDIFIPLACHQKQVEQV